MLLPMLMTPVVYPEWIISQVDPGEPFPRIFNRLPFLAPVKRLLYCLMGKAGELELACCPFPPAGRYPSLSIDFPAFQIFERELFEEYGIVPIRPPLAEECTAPRKYPTRDRRLPFSGKANPRSSTKWVWVRFMQELSSRDTSGF
jgi:hypothetical protein